MCAPALYVSRVRRRDVLIDALVALLAFAISVVVLRDADVDARDIRATDMLAYVLLIVYSASIASRWREQPVWFRLVGAALLIDPTWALADQHAATGASPESQRRFFLGAGITLGVWWAALIGVGAIIGDRLPHVGLELVAPLCLMSLIGTRVRDRANRWAAIAAAATALLTSHAPAGTGLMLAIAAGCVAAQVSRRWAR